MKIVFCLPGKTFTKGFVESWTDCVYNAVKGGVTFYMRTFYSSDIYLSRIGTLVGGTLPDSWEDAQVLNGVEYDYLVWIDSDELFTFEDVMQLISHEEDIVSGVVPLGSARRGSFGNFGRDERAVACLQYANLTRLDDLPIDERGLHEVDFAGFGFLCVKQGVFEKMGYPWFTSTVVEHGGRKLIMSEDTGWCYRAKQAGFKIFVDPKVQVGHEKTAMFTVPKRGAE